MSRKWRTANWCISRDWCRTGKFKNLSSQASSNKNRITSSYWKLHNVDNFSSLVKVTPCHVFLLFTPSSVPAGNVRALLCKMIRLHLPLYTCIFTVPHPGFLFICLFTYERKTKECFIPSFIPIPPVPLLWCQSACSTSVGLFLFCLFIYFLSLDPTGKGNHTALSFYF